MTSEKCFLLFDCIDLYIHILIQIIMNFFSRLKMKTI